MKKRMAPHRVSLCDRFSSKMLVLQGRRMSNAEFLKLRKEYSESDSLVNYRTWVEQQQQQQEEALRGEGEGGGSGSSRELVPSSHREDLFIPRGESHLPSPVRTNISESERASAARMFEHELDIVRQMRSGLEKVRVHVSSSPFAACRCLALFLFLCGTDVSDIVWLVLLLPSLPHPGFALRSTTLCTRPFLPATTCPVSVCNEVAEAAVVHSTCCCCCC